MPWYLASIEERDVCISGPFTMFIQHPKEILTLHKHVRRAIVNMAYPINSILVIQTIDREHAARFRFSVGHLETKKGDPQRGSYVYQFYVSVVVLHLFVFLCDDNYAYVSS